MDEHSSKLGEQQKERGLQRMGALAGAMAHELKNPLSTMSISLQLLMEDLESRPQIATAQVLPRIRLLREEIRQLERILGSFLELARAPQLELRQRDPNVLLQEIVGFVGPECLQNHVDLRVHCDSSIGVIEMDPDLFRQALINLIRNALQASPSGGTLTLITSAAPDSWSLDLIDTGRGIEPDVLVRIFDPYFTTRKGGTGIGLAVTRSVVERHGGSIEVQSAVGQGTRFHLTMPRKVRHAASA